VLWAAGFPLLPIANGALVHSDGFHKFPLRDQPFSVLTMMLIAVSFAK
jgi:hypothetical protein